MHIAADFIHTGRYRKRHGEWKLIDRLRAHVVKIPTEPDELSRRVPAATYSPKHALGWVNESGHAQEVMPGFGWERMLGRLEMSTTPRPGFDIR